jgi:hypothetical protein
LALLTIAFKWGTIWADSPLAADYLPDTWRPFLFPILTGAGIAVWLYKKTVMGAVILLSGRRQGAERIRQFNRFYMAVASYALVPVAILTALVDPEGVPRLFTEQVIVLIILALYYTAKSFSFFLSRNIPILQWILYLCAVEIWPFSFFGLFALRGFVW